MKTRPQAELWGGEEDEAADVVAGGGGVVCGAWMQSNCTMQDQNDMLVVEISPPIKKLLYRFKLETKIGRLIFYMLIISINCSRKLLDF